jgi:hypothetical protein
LEEVISKSVTYIPVKIKVTGDSFERAWCVTDIKIIVLLKVLRQ